MRMGGLSAPAALDSSGTDATLASNPILSFANAMKRASSVPAGTVSAARGGAVGGVGETDGGVGCGWVAITFASGYHNSAIRRTANGAPRAIFAVRRYKTGAIDREFAC